MIIILSGTPGSGKSTVAKALEERYGFQRNYGGGLFRQKAKEKGMILQEYLNHLERYPEEEKANDEELVKRALSFGGNVIYETRAGVSLMPDRLSILLEVSNEESARRIFADMQVSDARNEARYKTYEEALEACIERRERDVPRYQSLYGIHIYDHDLFDIVIDTTDKTPEEVLDAVFAGIESFVGVKMNDLPEKYLK